MLVCAICWEHFEFNKNNVCCTDCGHLFHTKCLDQWLATKTYCAECRHPCSMLNKIRIFANVSNSSPCDHKKTIDLLMKKIQNLYESNL